MKLIISYVVGKKSIVHERDARNSGGLPMFVPVDTRVVTWDDIEA